MTYGFPGSPDVCLQCGRPRFDPWVRKIPWRRKWHPTPALLPGESRGLRSPVGCSPWGRRVGHGWATSLSHFSYHMQTVPPCLIWTSVSSPCLCARTAGRGSCLAGPTPARCSRRWVQQKRSLSKRSCSITGSVSWGHMRFSGLSPKSFYTDNMRVYIKNT